MAKSSAEGLGLQSLLHDLGTTAPLIIHTDASAVIGIASRQGLGRIRHLATTDLWIQQRLKNKDFRIQKIDGEVNPGDLMTKALDGERIRKLLARMATWVPP